MSSNNEGLFIEDLYNAVAYMDYYDIVTESVWYLFASKLFRHRFGNLLSALEELMEENA